MSKNGRDEQLVEQETETRSEEESQDQSQMEQTTNSNLGGSGTELWQFNHPALKGKSPQEVEAFVRLAEQTVREQGQRLTEYEKELATRTTPAPTSQPPADDVDFWDNPKEAVRRTVESVMGEMIAPFRENLSADREGQVRAQLRQELKHWARLEPYIDQLLVQGNFPDKSNINLLRQLYYTAYGYVVDNGIQLEGESPAATTTPPSGSATTPEATMSNRQSSVPPQHRPSSAPGPASSSQKPRLRELTEAEEQIRRIYKMSHEEFLRWQDATPEDVVVMERTNG